MKLIIVVALALVAAVSASPIAENVNILRSTFDQQPEGAYNFNFAADNGIERDETGELKQVLDEENKPHEVVVVRGSYSFPGEDGKPIVVTYYADETGYHAEGDSIPKAAARR